MLVSQCRMIRNDCVPISHDKKFQNCARRTLSRVCRRVALDFTAVSMVSILYYTILYSFAPSVLAMLTEFFSPGW